MMIDILCRVVDNLGDIGFVYRLARALSEQTEAPRLRLVVDNPAAFAGICPGVDPDARLQTVEGWLVVAWNDPGDEAVHIFQAEPPRLVLECYACGRPAWFVSILFDENDPVTRHIVNLEYLTAESWARDFHRLPSLTRSPLVRKTMFMPGFEAGTGGLLQDAGFNTVLESCASGKGLRAVRLKLLGSHELGESGKAGSPDIRGLWNDRISPEEAFWVTVFSYEHDFSSMVADLAVFHAERPLLALVAAGRSYRPFFEAWNRAGRPFPILVLPLLPQMLWDAFLIASDFIVVRGEETLARACLSGRPFLWQCYPFGHATSKTGGQLPKVHALLGRIRPYQSPDDFTAFERLTLRFNGVQEEVSGDHVFPAGTSGVMVQPEPAPGDFLAVLRALESLAPGFAAWAQEVRNLGNLASNLLTFIHDLGYIK
jgi:uncharacterized repeat protein (TIGR03837 family)